MKTSLLIMAAGIGSRFGGGIKQLEPVGMNDEIIMDYSIHDAISAGFDKIIIVIRKAIEADFKERIGNRVEEVCRKLGVELCYAYQDLSDIPEGFSVPQDRAKPWGTGQAVLAARDFIHEPFMVVNADDYYGKDIFQKFHDYLSKPHTAYCMAGYDLANTLSENGSVTRGICRADGDMLVEINETHNIEKLADGAVSDGVDIPIHSVVSMNMWGFPAEQEGREPAYLQLLKYGFVEFLSKTVPENPLKAEYLLPIHIGELLEADKIQVRIIPTHDKWIGITYKEDMPKAQANFKKLIEDQIYGKDLYEDICAHP